MMCQDYAKMWQEHSGRFDEELFSKVKFEKLVKSLNEKYSSFSIQQLEHLLTHKIAEIAAIKKIIEFNK